MHEKEEMGGKYYLKAIVSVVVGLGQALLPNQDNVVVHGTHLFDLFSIYIFTVPKINRIIQDPIIKIIPFI